MIAAFEITVNTGDDPTITVAAEDGEEKRQVKLSLVDPRGFALMSALTVFMLDTMDDPPAPAEHN